MGFPPLEVGYTTATTGRGDYEVHKGHVVALKKTLSVFPGCTTLYPENYEWSALFLKTSHDDGDFKSPDSVSMHTEHIVTLVYCRRRVFGAPLSATALFGVLLKT
jgi:hypothetical protein